MSNHALMSNFGEKKNIGEHTRPHNTDSDIKNYSERGRFCCFMLRLASENQSWIFAWWAIFASPQEEHKAVTFVASPDHPLSHCHTVTLSYCHTATLSHCHTVTLSHSVVLPGIKKKKTRDSVLSEDYLLHYMINIIIPFCWSQLVLCWFYFLCLNSDCPASFSILCCLRLKQNLCFM